MNQSIGMEVRQQDRVGAPVENLMIFTFESLVNESHQTSELTVSTERIWHNKSVISEQYSSSASRSFS